MASRRPNFLNRRNAKPGVKTGLFKSAPGRPLSVPETLPLQANIEVPLPVAHDDLTPLQSDFMADQGFLPDDFQHRAFTALDQGQNVVVCAPTGSGKTLIAEYAAYKALEEGAKLFYTTPLKALSNQKYHDFCKRYGNDMVGLMTGDISLNRFAPITVMTTEIFRNLLYHINEDQTRLTGLKYLVLDECHYMNDPQRGTVWEETMIYCPSNIQMVALSATVANAQEMADWISSIHGETQLISSLWRPVPLRFFYDSRENLYPLFEQNSHTLNKRLKTEGIIQKEKGKPLAWQPNQMLEELRNRDMLPAIVFTFSRNGCDQNLKNARGLKLVTEDEQAQIRAIVDELAEQSPSLKSHPFLTYLENGVASHHAGLLPGFKVLVETLFQKGLLKVLFATETLAAGINMPARTTVISALSKRCDEGHRLLNASEFLQMAGRAGRRGMDEVGYVVIVGSAFEGAAEAALLASSAPDPLNSQFSPTYGMVLNLLHRISLDEAQFIIQKSFGEFTQHRRLRPLNDRLKQLESELSHHQAKLDAVGASEEQFRQAIKTKTHYEETCRLLRVLQQQGKRFGAPEELQLAITQAQEKRANLMAQLKPANGPDWFDFLAKNNKLERHWDGTLKQHKQVEQQIKRQRDPYWRAFSRIHQLLQSQHYIDENNKPTLKGEMMAQFRTENTLLLSELILSQHLDPLTPSELAGILSCITFDSMRDNKPSMLSTPPMVRQTLKLLQPVLRQVDRVQSQYGVSAPVVLNPTACPIVVAWADGLPWQQLVRQSGLAEGDMVRVLRRTADLLRQVAHGDHLSPELKANALIALRAVMRDPVKEVEVALPEAEEPTPPVTSEVTEAPNDLAAASD